MTQSTESSNGGDGRRRDPLGSAAEEAIKLFAAVQQRVARELGRSLVRGGASGFGLGVGTGDGAGDVWSEAVSAGHDGQYICRACPLCRAIAAGNAARGAVRDGTGDPAGGAGWTGDQLGAEIADRLLTAGGEIIAAFRQAVEVVQRPRTAASRPEAEPRVERVDPD